ncbi:MAG TPA: TetR/AcrR family transcriptional regulator C-terminal domain-containing protein [Acidimicrobiia bacterium]|nr:TetR/AcrR family transcriptional regulator C-terminal domain-containing protein [Acidimicrobiia bacterium]
MPDRRRATTSQPSGRVPRNTLSRAVIVAAALALVDEEGLEALTMPRLGTHLGVGTMSLYRHIEGKDDLLDGVAAQVLSGVTVPSGASDDWEGRVVGYLRSLRAEALRHPALARILADRGLTVGPVLEQLETVHGVLRTAGFSDLDAVRAFYSLLTYVFGSLMWELPRVHLQPPAAYAAAWHRALDGLDATTFPNLTALRAELLTSASADQFDYGLEHLVSALRQPAKAKRGRRPPAEIGP